MMTPPIACNANAVETLDRAILEADIKICSHSIVVVELRGEADAGQVDFLTEQLELSARRNPAFVILDLAELCLIGPEALASLESFRRQRRRQGGEVWLAGLQPAVWLAIHAAGLGEKFPIRGSLAAVFNA
jgi:anti-anti-sigma factor